MKCIDQVDALVIGIIAANVTWKLVCTPKDNEPRFRAEAYLVKERRQLRPRPTSDTTPSFNAVMPCDLGTHGHRVKVGKRETRRSQYQAIHTKSPIVEAILRKLHVSGRKVSGVLGAIGAEDLRNVIHTIFACEGPSPA